MDEIIDKIYKELSQKIFGGICYIIIAIFEFSFSIFIFLNAPYKFIIVIGIILLFASIYIIIISPKELGDVIRDMKAIKNGEYEVIVGKIVGVKEAGENTETRIKWYDSIVMDSESGEQVELWLIGHNDEDNKISKTEKEYTFYYVKNTKVAYCPELKNYK